MDAMSEDEIKKWKDQRKKLLPYFLAQLLLSFTLTSAILYGGYYYGPGIPVPKSNDFTDKLIYTLRFAGFPSVLVLFVAIMMVSNKRGTTPASNPLAGNEKFLQLDKNVLSNTVEQFLVFNFFNLVLITMLQPAEMRVVPVYTAVFVIGRILFRVGYGINPKFRSGGMIMQFFANFVIVGVIIYLMYTRGVLYNLATKVTHGSGAGRGKSEL